MNLFLLIGLLIVFGYLVGKGFLKIGLTSILGFLLAGVILGPVLKIPLPQHFGEIIAGLTLCLLYTSPSPRDS